MEESKERTIFKVFIDEAGMARVILHCSEENDELAIALAMYTVFDEHPTLLDTIESLSFGIYKDDEMRKAYEDSVVQIPDFNKFLKQK